MWTISWGPQQSPAAKMWGAVVRWQALVRMCPEALALHPGGFEVEIGCRRSPQGVEDGFGAKFDGRTGVVESDDPASSEFRTSCRCVPVTT